MKKEKPTTKICKYCKTEIPFDAKICPQCRKKQSGGGCLVAIGVVVAIGVLGSCFSGNSSNSATPASTEASSAAVESTETTILETTVEETTVSESASAEATVPTEYKSALRQADTYANTMHMSKARIYNQLISEYGEKFTEEEAQYAVDNVDADWNENALATAKNYQDNMALSPEAIRDQLTSEYGEEFTQEEADYAISHLE